MKLSRGRELVEIIPLAELYTTYENHERLQVFAIKGRFCVACGREGTFIFKSLELPRNKDKTKASMHVDLYTDDFILMTVDHITPKYIAKAAGWSINDIEKLDNKQPMCDPCNNRKGHKYIPLEELARRSKQNKNTLASVDVIYTLVENFHRLNGDYAILNSPQ